MLTKQLKWQQFTQESKQSRYLIGACLMGLGRMLAGGCAVGAGVTGGAILAITAWVALLFMWLGAGATDWLVDRRNILATPKTEKEKEKSAPILIPGN